jgi:hypothetical protein
MYDPAMEDEAMERFDRKMQAIIDRVGWMVQGVGAGENKPQFAYTVGLAPEHPELMVRGLGFTSMQYILNDLAMRLTHGAVLPLNEPIVDVLEPDENGLEFPVMITLDQSTDSSWGVANRWHRGHGVLIYTRRTVLWPDNEGRLPTDPTCDPECVRAQRPD